MWRTGSVALAFLALWNIATESGLAQAITAGPEEDLQLSTASETLGRISDDGCEPVEFHRHVLDGPRSEIEDKDLENLVVTPTSTEEDLVVQEPHFREGDHCPIPHIRPPPGHPRPPPHTPDPPKPSTTKRALMARYTEPVVNIRPPPPGHPRPPPHTPMPRPPPQAPRPRPNPPAPRPPIHTPMPHGRHRETPPDDCV
ncbi:hypothetical protein K461DRAFT_293153 [Myriangium duriaei CBS 260.36]|uniref:Uncharacterized protein n=1 Tax=Myriangium duriaei CBS 260.36 TaxID=1168546 RepID=A0A9P4IZN6_9PEZI|nr:hypothetical protein K461DRAFT_293153 [Myriangium duriaei CBS 260.36]